MSHPKRVFISVRYDWDQLVERCITAFLDKAGIETYRHDWTSDPLLDAEELPQLESVPGLINVAPSMMKSKRSKPSKLSSEFPRTLVEEVLSWPMMITIWSHEYSSSYWCMLELRVALLAKMPLLLICVDDHPIPPSILQEMEACPSKTLHIDDRFEAQEIESAILRLPKSVSKSAHAEAIARELGQFLKSGHDTDDKSDVPMIDGVFDLLVANLRIADDRGFLNPAIAHLLGVPEREYPELPSDIRGPLDSFGELDLGWSPMGMILRHYLERVASGRTDAPLERWYYTHVRDAFMAYKPLPPYLSNGLLKFYGKRINGFLAQPGSSAINAIVDELAGQCFFTREFAEHFEYHMRTSADRHTIRPVDAEQYREICLSRSNEAV